MLFRLRKALKRNLFKMMTRGILDTPAVDAGKTGPGKSGPIIFSMVSTFDVQMYLIAAKSMLRQIRGEIHILDDGTLKEADKLLLKRHLGDITIHDIAGVDTGGMPKGGCWERLIRILELTATGRYVIQMDSDVLTTGPIPDVAACVAAGRCFTLGTHDGTKVITLREAGDYAASFTDSHVQSLTEQAFARAVDNDKRYYVRGSAGFAGFAPNAIEVADAERFSLELSGMMGAGTWKTWGTEQITSNYLICNSENPMVLTAPLYVNHEPHVDIGAAHLLHFIGSWRYSKFHFAGLARAMIRELQSA